jgi:hypothetical protein
VIIKGWPDNISFRNLSKTSNLLSNLETLYRKWHCGGIYWKKLSSQELQDLDLQRNHQIKWGEAEAPAPQCCHSDFGKKCLDLKVQVLVHRKKHKRSRKVIPDKENSEEDREEESDREAACAQKRHCNVSYNPGLRNHTYRSTSPPGQFCIIYATSNMIPL